MRYFLKAILESFFLSTIYHDFEEVSSFWLSYFDLFFRFIWYDFKERRVIPAKISFMPRNDVHSGIYNPEMPSKFQFVATNDVICNDDSHWSVICDGDYTGEDVQSIDEQRFCQSKSPGQQKYRCLGLKILANHNHPFSSLRGIRIWAWVFA